MHVPCSSPSLYSWDNTIKKEKAGAKYVYVYACLRAALLILAPIITSNGAFTGKLSDFIPHSCQPESEVLLLT